MTLHISSVFTYDEDAGNYIQAVEAADEADTPGIGALEPATRQAINNFVLGCKADGIWDAIKASCILAGAKTLEGSFIDLKSATKILTNNNFADGTYVGSNYTTGDYNRKTGLVGDGSTKYLDSNRNNNTDPQNSKHLSVYANTLGSASTAYLGSGSGPTAGISQIYSDNTGKYASRSNSATLYSGGPQSIGLLAWSRGLPSAYTARYGNTNYLISSTSQTPNNSNIFVYGLPGISFYTNARLAFYSIGESLDLAKLDARVTDLITAFGAAIP